MQLTDMVSCSRFGLPMHAQLLRLFVTPQSYKLEQETIEGLKHTWFGDVALCSVTMIFMLQRDAVVGHA